MRQLDDAGLLALDTSGMFGRIREVGTELIRAWESSAEIELPTGAENAGSIVVAGMGGSASAGDYFAALCQDSAEIPVHVVRRFCVPNYVSDSTLAIIASYSGNTEEALSCYDDAWKRGAMIIAITTGGQLAERARADGVKVCTITYASPPRAAISHSFAPLLRIGAEIGVCGVTTADVVAAGKLHRDLVEKELHPGVSTGKNGAKQLAASLHGRIPFLLAAEHLAPVSARFRNQLCENGKALGATDTLPEADHNLIVGLGAAGEATECLSLLMIESQRLYRERTRRSFHATAVQFQEAGIPVQRLDIAGETVLEQLLQGTAWGDYVSCYLALLNGVDPTPTPQIDRVKAALTA